MENLKKICTLVLERQMEKICSVGKLSVLEESTIRDMRLLNDVHILFDSFFFFLFATYRKLNRF